MNHIVLSFNIYIMKKYFTYLLSTFVTLLPLFSQSLILTDDFSNNNSVLDITGRGNTSTQNGILRSMGSYASFGKATWNNYSIRFKARTPHSAEQVQIWSGFRANNRYDRYILGLRGGSQNNLYLSRMGYMGADEMLAWEALDFKPEPGVWYQFHIEVCKNRIRVFLNNESLPRIDVTDNSNFVTSGKITLGGSWIENEFDDLTITTLEENALENIPEKTYKHIITAEEKEIKRTAERDCYKPLRVNRINADRTEIKLDGDWLFMPTYELSETEKAISPSINDKDWHIMKVPEFWTPTRNWLHGERFGIKRFSKGVSDAYYQKETTRCENYTFDYTKTKAAWYRQWIELPKDIEGKILMLNFDAVAKVAEVYINGVKATDHIGMFGDFQADGSTLFKPGMNLITVKVTKEFIENIQDAEKIVDVAVTVPVTNKMLKDIAHAFYADPAGIWQPVSLSITHPLKIEDVFIKPALGGAEFNVTVKNYSQKKATFDVDTDITEEETENLFYSGNSLRRIILKPGEVQVLTYKISGLKPHLWSFKDPNLYDFSFSLKRENETLDKFTVRSGFRTFEAKGDYLYLNGHPYWLRGGNHIPYTLARDNEDMANTFYQLMKAANIEMTRAVTSPFNKLWTYAADANGIGISHEGTWPWLMINNSMPDSTLIKMWVEEYLSIIKKYRNHPSIIIWTINNEMKFYDNEPDFEIAKKKMGIISDVVKEIRKIDPTRPICFDSNYKRNEKKFGKEFFTYIDDGDIDDIHSYYNWYDHTIFKQFNGEFQKNNKNPGRPLISQEMSTGYPNNDTGHPVRFYTIMHQNPQSLIGYEAYDYADPNSFLEIQSFITGELAEAIRRSNNQIAGIVHFALITWFRNVHDPENIDTYPAYHAMRRALQPVLVSAEIWGRHFYAGDKLPVDIYIVNDHQDRRKIEPTLLHWELTTACGKVLSSGKEPVSAVEYYKRTKISPTITIPAILPQEKTYGRLKLRLTEKGITLSENEYKLLFAQKNRNDAPSEKNIALLNWDNLSEKMDCLNIEYKKYNTISELLASKSDLFILSGVDGKSSNSDIKEIRKAVSNGKNILISNSPETARNIYPEYIINHFIPSEGDIVNMEIPESPVFNDIHSLELRYFNNNKREVPAVCNAALRINRNEKVTELASHIKIHGYLRDRENQMKDLKGFTLLEINDNGKVLLSTMSIEKCDTDPIAGKLFTNMINYLLEK